MFKSLFVLGLMSAAAAAQIPPPTQTKNPSEHTDTCTIQGVVVKAGTGEPLHKAWVDATPENARTREDVEAGGSAETDAMGRFEITGLAPGRYHLSASRDGFVMQSYGQSDPSKPLIPWTLSPGQKLENIAFQLTPAGVISGHVYDEDGEPVLDGPVQALRYGYENGQRQLLSQGWTKTNDLGEYRLFGLNPGRYFVMATGPDIHRRVKNNREGFGSIYYPGVLDPARAAPVDVVAGGEFSGVDFSLQLAKTYTVRGHVDFTACGGSSAMGWVTLRPVGPYQQPNMIGYDLDRGAFEITGVSPGSYTILVYSANQHETSCVGQEPVEVTDGDIDGISVTSSADVEINGRLRVDGQLNFPMSGFTISLSSRNPNLPFGGSRASRISQDGSLTMKAIPGGPYDIDIQGIPPGGYIKSARIDGVDVLAAGLTVDPKQGLGSFEIVISPNGATLQGVVLREQQPFQGATVVLAPDPPNRSQKRLFKSTASDANGHFQLQGIAPGDYKVFAWEKIEEESYESPDVLQQYEKQGQSIHIDEGSNNSVQPDLIPASQAAQ
jgi:protocatechuate 3,4-dioxygenase beta subunit